LHDAYLVLPGADEVTFDFRHALIRDTLYADTDLPTRRRLHERVARAAVDRGYRGAFISAHFEQAQCGGLAHEYAVAAAGEAASVSAHGEALELYRRAVRNLPGELPAPERAALFAALGDEAAATDDNTAAAQAYRTAHELIASAGDVRAAAATLRGVAVRTPLVAFGPPADRRLLKAESAHRAGAARAAIRTTPQARSDARPATAPVQPRPEVAGRGGLPWYEVAHARRAAEGRRDCGELEHLLQREWSEGAVPPPETVRAIDRLAELPSQVKEILAAGLDAIFVGPGGVPDLDDMARLHGVPLPSGRATWDACAGAYGERKIIVGSRRSAAPDVVLMDVRMPFTDGVQATGRLKQRAGSPPVLALTTFDDDQALAGMLRAGASGFVLKGVPAEDLQRAVRTVAEGGAWLDPAVTGRVLATYRSAPAATGPAGRDRDLDALTGRELEVLALIGRGKTNGEIAAELFVSEGTVKTHVNHVFTKLRLRDRAAAVVFAFDHGLVERSG